MFFIRSIRPQAPLVHPEEKWHNKFAVWWMTAPLCVSCNGAGDKEPSGCPIRALLFDKYGLVRCLKRWPGFIEPAILDTAKWVTGKLEAKEEAVRWHIGYWPMKWRSLEVQSRGPAGAETSSPLTPSGFEGLWSISESAKWSRWRTAEKDISHSIQPGRTVCLRGVGGGGEDPPPQPCPPPTPNIKCHTLRQWMDNGYPSIFQASLSRCSKPTTMSILRQFDPLSWVIHQTDLICKPLFLKGRRVASAGTNDLKVDLFFPLKRKMTFKTKLVNLLLFVWMYTSTHGRLFMCQFLMCLCLYEFPYLENLVKFGVLNWVPLTGNGNYFQIYICSLKSGFLLLLASVESYFCEYSWMNCLSYLYLN